MTFDVLDQSGSPVGRLKMAICHDYDELESHLPFSNLPSGFDHFARQLPTQDIYPVAVLSDLAIHDDRQRQGFGRLAIRAFIAVSLRHQAKLGVLKVGTQGDPYCSGLRWRRRFYISEGWKSFRKPNVRGLVIHWMYHLLDRPPSVDRDISTILSQVDEDAEFLRLFRRVN
jgi:GNAT superfamily N-acetyltransferase